MQWKRTRHAGSSSSWTSTARTTTSTTSASAARSLLRPLCQRRTSLSLASLTRCPLAHVFVAWAVDRDPRPCLHTAVPNRCAPDALRVCATFSFLLDMQPASTRWWQTAGLPDGWPLGQAMHAAFVCSKRHDMSTGPASAVSQCSVCAGRNSVGVRTPERDRGLPRACRRTQPGAAAARQP